MTPLHRTQSRLQRGISLIEVMVGLTIGLAIVGIALAGVHISRQLAGTTSSVTHLQQQAAYALRVIAGQVRQAGSLPLNLAFNQDPEGEKAGTLSIDPADPVAFDTRFDRKALTLASSTARPLQVGFSQHLEALHNPAARGPNPAPRIDFQQRDCLGNTPDSTTVGSQFYLTRSSSRDPTGQLLCAGSAHPSSPQGLIADVADFRVRWLRQQLVGGEPLVSVVDSAEAAQNWGEIYAAEVCLEMAGSEPISTLGQTYQPCAWKPGDRETDRGNRLRLVYRSTFQLRSQGPL